MPSALPLVLSPYDAREALGLKEAAGVARRSVGTVRMWCGRYHVGRRIVGGRWEVSRVALAMLLDGDRAALEAYLGGDRTGPLVAPYFVRAGLEARS